MEVRVDPLRKTLTKLCFVRRRLFLPAVRLNRNSHRPKLTTKIADRLPSWKENLLNMAGRNILVRFVLSAIPVYLLVAINVPKWVIKAINKIRRAFLWKGREQVNGGCCLVAWEKVQRPIDLGGLGIPNLEVMGWALQIRWMWFSKTQTDRPWKGLDLPAHPNVRALFAISVVTQVGNGTNTLFWTDCWLHGCSISDLAPLVVSRVPTKIIRSRTMAEALEDQNWTQDILGAFCQLRRFLNTCNFGIPLLRSLSM